MAIVNPKNVKKVNVLPLSQILGQPAAQPQQMTATPPQISNALPPPQILNQPAPQHMTATPPQMLNQPAPQQVTATPQKPLNQPSASIAPATKPITTMPAFQSTPYNPKYDIQMMETLSALTDMLKTPLTYDSSKDEGFQGAQKVIGNNVYNDMARRGIAHSTITPEQSYQLSMQALPQFQANFQNQQQQGINNQMSMLSQLGQLDQGDYMKYADTRDFGLRQYTDARDFDFRQQVDSRDFDYMKYADTRDYDFRKDVDTRDFDFRKNVDTRDFDFMKNVDTRDFDFKKQADTRDFDFMKTTDQRNFDYQQTSDNQQNLYREADLTGQLYTPEQKQLINTIDPNLQQYGNDYQAEINRRMAINPNDPTIFQLQYLRNQKIQQGGLSNQLAQLGAQTMASQQFDYGKQRDFTTDTGIRFENQEQYNAYTKATSGQLNSIISKYADKPGGIQAYINTLNPYSAQYTLAQMARNQLISQSPELQKYGLSQLGTQTMAGQQHDQQIQTQEQQMKLIDQEIKKGDLTLKYLPKQLEQDLDRGELQNIGMKISNDIATIDLKYHDEKTRTEISRIKEDLEAGRLSNAAQRIQNSNMDAMLKSQIASTWANQASTMYDITYKDGSLDIQRSQLDIQKAELGMKQNNAAISANNADYKYVSGIADNYRKFINSNYMTSTNKNGKTTKSLDTSKAKAYLEGIIEKSGTDEGLAAVQIAQEMGIDLKKK